MEYRNAYLAMRYFNFAIKDTEFAICPDADVARRFLGHLGDVEGANGERPVDRIIPLTVNGMTDFDIDITVMQMSDGKVSVSANLITNEHARESVLDNDFVEFMRNLGGEWQQLTLSEFINNGKDFTFHTNGMDYFHTILHIKRSDFVDSMPLLPSEESI